eukprot:5405215-Amphidinium_carterae.2
MSLLREFPHSHSLANRALHLSVPLVSLSSCKGRRARFLILAVDAIGPTKGPTCGVSPPRGVCLRDLLRAMLVEGELDDVLVVEDEWGAARGRRDGSAAVTSSGVVVMSDDACQPWLYSVVYSDTMPTSVLLPSVNMKQVVCRHRAAPHRPYWLLYPSCAKVAQILAGIVLEV